MSHAFRSRQPLAYSLASSALFATFGLIGYITYTASFPADVITMRVPLEVRPAPWEPIIRPGSIIAVRHDYCKKSEQYAQIGVYLSDMETKIVIPITVTVAAMPVGCHVVDMLVPIPTFVPPGRYTLTTTRDYRPSPYTTRSYEFKSEPFVISGPPAAQE